ncbi:AmmeMemoRadiSam system protein A [Thiohalorhabdus methylotrophus]|uniref:AmmeMemoRadiSam system protein A n=1 Tax=Thiohalorhabdus methylotrophus TaxID=3242694 RepID=A0ABV4TYI3_9GAMM
MSGAAEGSQGEPRSLRPYSERLLRLASAAIDHGLNRGSRMEVDLGCHPAPLLDWRACFVTLRLGGELRGCVGSVEPRRPLVSDIAENAYTAAFGDPRFPGLTAAERKELSLKLEILSPMECLNFRTEAELLARLEPGRDGLLLEAGHCRGTFLPTVWSSLPDPEEFWKQLKRKAGLPSDRFSTAITVYRYRTEILP